MHLARFPRVRLAHLPTPLEPLPRLSEELGVDLWIKRDDCTGLAGGGNKTRKLEFLLGEAFEQEADTLVTQGAVQSNHVRQTAAAAAAHGLACEVILEERTGSKAHDYVANGNVLLDRLLGANHRFVPGGSDMVAELERTAAEVRLTRRAAAPMPPISSASGGTAVRARHSATPMTPMPSDSRNRPWAKAIRVRASAVQPIATRPANVIVPSPIKSSESAFSAWLLAMNPPTISHRPKPRFRITTIQSARR